MKSVSLIKSVIAPVGVLGSALAGLALGLKATSTPVLAAPKPSPTLSFELTARFAMKDTSVDDSTPEQTVSARVYMDGKRIRAESQLADRFVIYLYAPPFGYKLLPNSKTGLRYRVGSSIKTSETSNFDPQALLPLLHNPSALRSSITKQGGKRVSTVNLNGTPVDVYTANKFRGQPVKVKAWLRRSDALPARIELASKKLSVTASWRNYQRGKALSGALFTVPANYHVRQAQSASDSM